MSGALGFGFGAVAARRRGAAGPPGQPWTPPQPIGPDWPEGAVALWLIFGQSNAEGYAPWRQDPARTDPAAAQPALSPAERQAHPWLRLTTRGAGPNAGQFPASGQGLATDAAPRTSSKVWQASLGIPAGTPSFGPEVGLVRHVLSGAAPAAWRDDAQPRLWLFKQTEGGQSVDHFRWGGAGQGLILNALRQTGAENLTTLAAGREVLVQGVIFVIGEKDSVDLRADGGGSMAATLAVRFADWVRQIRGALGVEAPVAFVEIHDAVDARKQAANAALHALAAALPAAVAVPRAPDWTEIGDGVHYDAQGQDRLGAAAFAAIRTGWGRPGDGLVTGRRFTGLRPWFHVPPVFVFDGGTRMQVAAVAAVSGMLHARITAEGAPAPAAETIRDQSEAPGGFRRALIQDQEEVWFTALDLFTANVTEDVHFVLEGADGVLGERVTVRRGGNVKFAPKLTVGAVGSETAELTLRPSFAGTLRWALHAGERGWMRTEDVEAMAFQPVQAGETPCTANATVTLSLTGLTPGTGYTLFAAGRRTADGLASVGQREVFATA